MTDRVLLALPDGRWLALEPAALQRALAEGAAVMGAPAALSAPESANEDLLSAGQMAIVLNLPKSCVYEKARAGELPSIRLGKHVRFNRAAVLKAVGLTDQQAVGRG